MFNIKYFYLKMEHHSSLPRHHLLLPKKKCILGIQPLKKRKVEYRLLRTGTLEMKVHLRTFARKFSNIYFFQKILPLKDDELVMSET